MKIMKMLDLKRIVEIQTLHFFVFMSMAIFIATVLVNLIDLSSLTTVK